MLGRWIQHFWKGVQAEDGWLLFFNAAFGSMAFIVNLAVLVVAVVTVIALIDQLRSQQWSEAVTRGDKIASDLQSDKVWDRITGLHALQTYPYEYRYVSVPHLATPLAPFEVAKNAILLHLDRFSVMDLTDNSARTPGNVNRPSADDTTVSKTFEKSLALKVLSDLGAAGWYGNVPQQTPTPSLSLLAALQIDLHWIVTARPSDAKLVGQPVHGIATADPLSVMEEKDLSGIKVDHSDLSCISMVGSVLTGLQASQVAFFATELSDADLTNVQLEYVDLVGIIARHAKFAGANIIGASTNLQGNLHTTLVSERYDDGAMMRCLNESGMRPRGPADFTGATFRNVSLRESDLGGSILNSTDFSAAHIDNTTFSGAIHGERQLVRCLTGSDTDDITPARSGRPQTQAQISRFVRASLRDVHFDETDLRSSDFSGASLACVQFKGAVLDGASFQGAIFEFNGVPELLTEARSMIGTNFADARFGDEQVACALLERGAVFVADEQAWSNKGRPESDWLAFASEKDRARLAGCRSPPPTAIGNRVAP
jgi:uncharacterized protein YjbI with pentapeptide repeats